MGYNLIYLFSGAFPPDAISCLLIPYLVLLGVVIGFGRQSSEMTLNSYHFIESSHGTEDDHAL